MQSELRSVKTPASVFKFLIVILPILYALADAAVDANEDVNIGENTKVPHNVPFAASPIVIDGDVDETAWEQALVLELNYEVQPGENIPPPVRTEVLLTYDRAKLYVAYRCYDPDPSAIRARIRDRDELGGDDWVGVVLDTFNDERRSFKFECNPFGAQYDMIETESNSDSGWDAIWDSAGKITSWGYSVEMAIPFNQLRFQRADGPQIWGFDAVRNYPRNQRHEISMFPRDRSNNCYLCQAIKIVGFDGASPGRNIEITPTLTASRTDERSDLPDGELEKASQDTEIGLNSRWGMTPNMTLNFTANPDFSQVEADASQLDVNRPFAIFYPEKRPFFTEGADFFDTSISTVYTRMIRDPSWGLKITGKEQSNTIGAYVVRDDLTNIVLPGSQYSSSTSLRTANTSSVFRYKRDIGNKYTLGLLATDREGGDYFNRLFGFDGYFRFTAQDSLEAQFLGSSTQYPEKVAEEFGQDFDSFSGRAIYLSYVHNTRSHDLFGSYKNFSSGFRADLGYLPRVDYREYMAGWSHAWWGNPGSWWWMFNLGARYTHIEDQQSNPLDRDLTVWFYYRGEMQSRVDVIVDRRREAYNGLDFDQTLLRIFSNCRPNRYVDLAFNAMLGDRIDYANIRPGKRVQLNPAVSLELGLHLRLNFDHVYERMTVDDGRLYIANISQLNAVYQFNTRSFFRSIFQYVDYRYNSDIYSFEIEPEHRRLCTQLLFSYKLNPQTVLFIGYSDDHSGRRDYGLTLSDRTFFIKLGYAWVL